MADTPTIGTVKLTAKGLRLLAKVQAGALSQFTKAVIGDGFMPDDQDVAGLTALISEIPSHQTGEEATSATVDITRITYGEGTVTLRIKIKNGDTAFYLRELGIKAQDPDEGEVIYAYINFGDGASAMPAFDDSTYVTRNIELTFIISNAANVSANVTLPAEVSYEEFENHRMADVLEHPDGCVTREKIADSAVGIQQLDKSSVSSEKICAGAVQAKHIENGSVTEMKLSDNIISKISSDNVQTVRVTSVNVDKHNGSELPMVISTETPQVMLNDVKFTCLDFQDVAVDIDNIIENIGAGLLYSLKINDTFLYEETGGTTLEYLLPQLVGGEELIGYDAINSKFYKVNSGAINNVYQYVNHMFNKLKNAIMPTAETLTEES